MRMFKGNPPCGDGWMLMARFEAEGAWWMAWMRDNANGWAAWKIHAEVAAPGKANFWWGQNMTTGRANRSKDIFTMKQNRPELYAATGEALGTW